MYVALNWLLSFLQWATIQTMCFYSVSDVTLFILKATSVYVYYYA